MPSSGVSGTIWKEARYNKVLGNISVCLYFLLANVSIPLLLLLYYPLLSPKSQFFGLPMRRGISGSLRILQTFSATLGLLSYLASVLSSYWILGLSAQDLLIVSHSTKSSIGSISHLPIVDSMVYKGLIQQSNCMRFVYL